MRFLTILPFFALVTGCGGTWSDAAGDLDGDGFSPMAGDCWDNPVGGATVYPGAPEIWYDGIDQDCAGDNDFDQDKDGFDAIEAEGGTDCWDDPTATPAEYTALNGFPAVDAAEVYPGAADTWYDGIDQNCDLADDFDQDEDGYASSSWPQRGGAYGDDCLDATDDTYPIDVDSNCTGDGTTLDPADVNPGAEDTWYDGTDANCDGNDFDSDGDEFDRCEECDDTKAEIYPNDQIEEEWYDEEDENCDGNRADQDGDGFYDADFAFYDATIDFAYPEPDDCWDDPAITPDGFEPLDGFSALEAGQVYPGATDRHYDGIPQDCDADDGWEFDADHDGQTTSEYDNEFGVSGDDCDDDNADIYAGHGEEWYNGVDDNCDGGDDYDQDLDGHCAEPYSGCDDCDDTQDDISPSLNEDCNTPTVDDNCDGAYDLQNATDCDVWYYDGDRDTYGKASSSQCWCEAQTATYYDQADDDDCDDSDADTFPGAASLNSTTACMNDDDGDNYGDENVSSGVTAGTDCDDASSSDYPGATETVNNGDDEDCDDVDRCYQDADNDNFGTTTTIDSTDLDCNNDNMATVTTDCDDSDADTFPGAATNDSATACMNDDDGDNYGDETVSAGVTAGTDCDDGSNTDYPGATETVNNGDDEDCDDVDSCYTDADNDNYGTTVVIDSTDLDCNNNLMASVSTDCDDSDADTFPGAASTDSTTACMNDDDGDNYGDMTVASGVTAGTDCDDASSGDNPAATEIVNNGDDEDCDNVDACYTDADDDNYGTSVVRDSTDLDCNNSLMATVTTDCDDGDADTFPGAASNDSTTACMNDDDGDNYGDLTVSSGVTAGTDCDDASSSDYPSASETVNNGDDEDCDGFDSCYTDADNDDYGTTTVRDSTDLSCNHALMSTVATDCDDGDADTFPGAAEEESATSCMNDDDGDGFGDQTASASYVEGTDCDDADADDNPDGVETCNNDDEDCDGTADDGLTVYYTDSDGDGYGAGTGDCSITSGVTTSTDCDASDPDTFPGAASNDSTTDCMNDDDGDNWGDETVSSGVTAGTDCNDGSSSIKPGATELVGDSVDQNCDDDETCYLDYDNDGYVPTAGTTVASTTNSTCNDSGEATNSDPQTDCDDNDADTFPGAASLDSTTSCMNDDDGDNYGDSTVSGTVVAGDDCDDASSSDYPGATELCNDDDDDCDGTADDGLTVYYTDSDGDGYGAGTGDCSITSGVTTSTDCDPADPYTFPGAASLESSTDCMTDVDGDNYGDDTVTGTIVAGDDCDDSDTAFRPNATEIPADGIDQNCDTDELCYIDGDEDGFGSSDTVTSNDMTCVGVGESDNGDDCDDVSEFTYPGAAYTESGSLCMNDDDGDGWGDELATGGVDAGTDCLDDSATVGLAESVNPGASSDVATGDLLQENDDCDDYVDEDSITESSVVISEFFVSGGVTLDWVEIYNNTDGVGTAFDINLDDWQLKTCDGSPSLATFEDCVAASEDPSPSATVRTYNLTSFDIAGTNVAGSGYAVLCQDDSDLGAICDLTATSGTDVGTSAGFALYHAGELIDAVYFTTSWPGSADESTEYCAAFGSSTAADNDVSSAWAATSDLTGYYPSSVPTYYGTPGAVAECP